MKKPKFNIEVFFKTFAKEKEENISKELKVTIDALPENLFTYSLSCGYGEKDENNFYDSLDYMDDDYASFINPKKSFLHISKDFGYFPILQIHDNEPSGVWISQTEYGYLYTEKSNLSFLISSGYYRGDGSSNEYPSLVKIFKKFNKKKINGLSKLVLNHLKGTRTLELCNTINLNKNIKWNYKLLSKIFIKASIWKRKIKKEWEEPKDISTRLDVPKWYYDIWFFTMNEKKMTSKTPSFSFDKAIVKIEPSGKIIKLK